MEGLISSGEKHLALAKSPPNSDHVSLIKHVTFETFDDRNWTLILNLLKKCRTQFPVRIQIKLQIAALTSV
jgi:hypothetical protein